MRSFTVETRGQGAVIFGGPNELVASLIQELFLVGIHAVAPVSPGEIESFHDSYDLDYLVVFSEFDLSPFHSLLEPLVRSGESRLIYVSHLSDKSPKLELPISKRIIYGDYAGGGEIKSPLLESWLEGISQEHKIIIPGDGLEETSLLSLSDLSHLLSAAIIRPGAQGNQEFFIGNPTSVSLLNLAYLVRESASFKVNLVFDSTGENEPPVFNPESFTRTLEDLGYKLIGSEEEDLKHYLSSYFKNTPRPPQIESPGLRGVSPQKQAPHIESPAPWGVSSTGDIAKGKVGTPKAGGDSPKEPTKKLTPLVKKNIPVFVPLEPRRPKLKLTIKMPTKAEFVGRLRPKTIIGKGLIIAAALYLGTLAFAGTVAGLSLRYILTSVQNRELPRISSLNQFAVTYLQANWLVLTSIPGINQKSSVAQITLLLDAYDQALSVFSVAADLGKSAGDLTHYIFGSGNADIAQTISLSRLQTEEIYGKLSLLDGTLPVDPPSVIPTKYKDAYLSSKSQLSQLKRAVITAKAVLATTPDLIGLGGRRKYGVLFQNNMELRATGGFIGSFAILSFENGKLYDMPIFDVYDADGQLKGHVEPPTPIKNILGEANWYLRDSNFDPDFPTSARRAEWFIKKSLNQDLDGTIAVNVNTLIDLLEAVGPLQVPDYNETITATNLYERAQFHAEVNFFPGSAQKKEFLSSVADALFATLPTRGEGDSLKLIRSLQDSIEAKNTLISLTSAGSNHVFETLGWSGAITDLPCPSPDNCHKDYAMVVDSNFGVNKANYFIKRTIEQIITFDKNLGVNHVLRLNYQNTSTSTAWPAGAYKNYQRLYLPVGALVSSVKLGGIALAASEYTISAEHNKTAVAYLINVPINSSLTVEVEYSTPQLSGSGDLLYTWYWQKQPGTASSDPLTVYLNYPMYLRPTIISPTAELGSQQLKFSLQNDTDRRVTVKFSK